VYDHRSLWGICRPARRADDRMRIERRSNASSRCRLLLRYDTRRCQRLTLLVTTFCPTKLPSTWHRLCPGTGYVPERQDVRARPVKIRPLLPTTVHDTKYPCGFHSYVPNDSTYDRKPHSVYHKKAQSQGLARFRRLCNHSASWRSNMRENARPYGGIDGVMWPWGNRWTRQLSGCA
jgi:hypothetical protein